MPPRDLDLGLLRTFLVTVETENLTGAARRLGLSQPAVSQQLSRLEERLGVALFYAGSRRHELTREGRLLLTHARRLFRAQDDMLAELEHANVAGRVVLGTPDLYAAAWLPGVLRPFRQQHPDVRVDLECALSPTLHLRVDQGAVDLALVTRTPEIEGGTPIRRERLVWAEGRDASFDDPEVPLAVLPPGMYYRDLALRTLQEAGITARIAVVSENLGGLYAAALAGLAVTVIGETTLDRVCLGLTESIWLPRLPEVDLILLRRADTTPGSAADLLGQYIIRRLAPS